MFRMKINSASIVAKFSKRHCVVLLPQQTELNQRNTHILCNKSSGKFGKRKNNDNTIIRLAVDSPSYSFGASAENEIYYL